MMDISTKFSAGDQAYMMISNIARQVRISIVHFLSDGNSNTEWYSVDTPSGMTDADVSILFETPEELVSFIMSAQDISLDMGKLQTAISSISKEPLIKP